MRVYTYICTYIHVYVYTCICMYIYILRITLCLQQSIACNIPMNTTIEWPVVIMLWFSTPHTPFCLVCNSKLKYICDFTTLSDPGSIFAGFQWTEILGPPAKTCLKVMRTPLQTGWIFCSRYNLQSDLFRPCVWTNNTHFQHSFRFMCIIMSHTTLISWVYLEMSVVCRCLELSVFHTFVYTPCCLEMSVFDFQTRLTSSFFRAYRL